MNNEYRKLAYERAVLMTLVRVAQERFLPIVGADEAEVKIECEDLPRNESVVPEDAIIDVVLRLRQLAINREVQMGSFKFVNTEASNEQEWAEAASKSESNQEESTEAGPAGKGKGGESHQQPAAARRGGQKPAHPGAKKPARGKSSGNK